MHITDRIKDVIKTGGEWVSSLQIEDLITQCPGVAEAAVIGVKDDRWGERPLAFVVRGPKRQRRQRRRDQDPSEVFADKGIIPNTASRRKSFSSTAPRTSVGKINKKELREKYGDL